MFFKKTGIKVKEYIFKIKINDRTIFCRGFNNKEEPMQQCKDFTILWNKTKEGNFVFLPTQSFEGLAITKNGKDTIQALVLEEEILEVK